MENRKEFIVEIVKEAKDIVKRRIDETYDISIKNNNESDLVTAVDVEIEKFLVNRIQEQYPNDGFLTEESTVEMEDKEYIWVIDPIDGTMNFVYTLRDFAISVALYHNKIGETGVIYDVMMDELFVAKRNEGATLNGVSIPKLEKTNLRQSIVDVSLRTMVGLKNKGIADLVPMSTQILSHRNLGSAALRIAHIATGRVHMYISDTLCIWDFGAGLILLDEVGAYHNFQEQDELKFDNKRVDFFGANNPDLAKDFKDKFYY